MVRTADARAASQQDGGQPGHAAAADPNHVDADIPKIEGGLPSWRAQRL